MCTACFEIGEAVEWGPRVFQLDYRIALPIIDVALLIMVERYAAKFIALVQVQSAGRGVTDAGCIRQHSIEYRLKFSGRIELIILSTSDVAVCCSSDSERSRVRSLHLVEQAYILDCNHCLVGESGQQTESASGRKGCGFFALQRDDAENGSLSHHRYGKSGAHADEVDEGLAAGSRSYSGSARTSGTWIVRPSRIARPKSEPRSGSVE